MEPRIDDIRIKQTRPLIQPAILTDEIVRTPAMTKFIAEARATIDQIIKGQDDRVMVVVGPCSVHSTDASLEFAQKLKPYAEQFQEKLYVVMRAYFEKPRTVAGWKGLINDPDLDGTHKINKGLRLARTFLQELAGLELPAATEFLDTTVPQHISDLVSWGAIGARTVESQTHRELASGLSMPIGFKNATDGRIQPAVDAVLAAGNSHWFSSTTKDGVAALSQTAGNNSCHIILRGGHAGPNFSEPFVEEACERLAKAGLPERVMIDFSHGNSGKDYRRQKSVCEDVSRQIETGNKQVLGVMIESHLVEGRQDYGVGEAQVYGQSITDSCSSLEETVEMLDRLANSL